MQFRNIRLSPINQRRFQRFKAHKRGWYSLWVFLALFIFSLGAELVANDKPLLIKHAGEFYFPVLFNYSEQTFGGELPTEADYRDSYVIELIESDGWLVYPPIRFSYNTINYDLPSPAPSPPDATNWLGTDDQGRDVVARVIYGFRISVLFGLTLTIISSIMLGTAAGPWVLSALGPATTTVACGLLATAAGLAGRLGRPARVLGPDFRDPAEALARGGEEPAKLAS